MGEYALYCGLGDRVAVLTYTKQEEKKHLLLEKDLAAYGTSGKSRTRRRWITPEEQKSCRARLESWLVAIVIARRPTADVAISCRQLRFCR